MGRSKNQDRVEWVDTGKAMAIALVLFSHLTEALYYRGFPYGDLVTRLNGCIIIQYFFFLSGYVARDRFAALTQHVRKQALLLLVPMFYFNLLALALLGLIRFFYQGELISDRSSGLIIKFVALFAGGLPAFNGPTWFLTALFTVQLIYFFVAPHTRSGMRLLISMIVFSVVGYAVIPLLDSEATCVKVIKYAWYIPTALTAIVFFQLGRLVQRSRITSFLAAKRHYLWLGLIVSGAVLAGTFNLNASAYEGYWKVYHLNILNLGNYFIFYGSSIAGITWATCASMLMRPDRRIIFYGKHTLIVLGLSGLIHYFINPSIFHLVMKFGQPLNRPAFILLCAGITLAQLVLCRPFLGPISRNVDWFRRRGAALWRESPRPAFGAATTSVAE